MISPGLVGSLTSYVLNFQSFFYFFSLIYVFWNFRYEQIILGLFYISRGTSISSFVRPMANQAVYDSYFKHRQHLKCQIYISVIT